MNEHLLITDLNGRRRLRLLESLVIDRSLPKHTDKQADILISGGFASIQATNTGFFNTSLPTMVVNGSVNSGARRPSTLSLLWAWLRRRQVAVIERIENARAVSPLKTFEAILGGGKKLKNLTDRLDAYHKSIEHAKSMGQTALAEQLAARLLIIQSEAILVSGGYTDYIEESTLVDFVSRCEKGLRLDYVKNFTRLVPHKVQVAKVKMDELRVFDNYAILHYDPANKSAALTKAEVEKKKDPILFGLIKDSPRLYLVGSWKDEFCTLTFDDLIERYGDKALTLQ